MSGISVVLMMFFSRCANNMEDVYFDEPDLYSAFDFGDDIQGWIGGFSGYPEGQEDSLQLFSGYAAFPDNLGLDEKTLTVSGKNPQMNLFYFVKRRIDSLIPNTAYQVYFETQFIVETREGDPENGEVYVKFGAFSSEPEASAAIPEGANVDKSQVLINMDIGMTPESEGTYVRSLGALELPRTGETKIFRASNKDRRIVVSTNSQGELWILIGFDSRANAHLAFYFQNINAYYKGIY